VGDICEMNEHLGFTFAGRTIDYFGSNSITSDITALFELIKNSRDANAKKVTIHFKEPNTSNAQIVVSDDGDGMSEMDVKENWMVLGTDSRLQNRTTKKGKPVWGEKGIGRMACQKLGGKTLMKTVQNKQSVKMTFDWSLFEKPGITVDKIKFLKETSNAGEMEKGLTLEIENLKSEWSSKKINDFKVELSVLISDDDMDDIEVVIKVGREEGERIGKNYSKLRQKVTKNAPFKLSAKFDGKELGVKVFVQVGQKGLWEELDVVPSTYDEATVGPFSVDIYHFPRAPGKEKQHILETYYDKRITIEKLDAFLKNNHGLYLYRDGVWMKPYGGDTDWLAMEAGARQETSKIGIKQIYGQINMSKKKNPEIKPASHRETLIDNRAFTDLKIIMKAIFETLKNFMKDWKKQQQKTVLKDMGAKTMKVDDTIDTILKRMSNLAKKLPPQEKKLFQTSMAGIINLSSMQKEDVEKKLTDMGEIRSYEKNLATLGIATSFMARQVTEPLEKNMEIVAEGEEMRAKIKNQDWKLSPKEIARSEKMLESMKENQSKMLHFMKFVGVLADHISQSIRRNKRYTQVDVLDCWEIVSDGFQDRKKELDISIDDVWANPYDKKAGETLKVKIDRIDLECIFTNLYLNSIESLRKTKGRRRLVTFHYWHHDNSLYIEFSDNGIGIPKRKLEEVFEPFKFGHNPDDDEMHGHGLGLYIVKKIMENYDGTAKAIDVNQGAKIQLVFPNMKKVVS